MLKRLLYKMNCQRMRRNMSCSLMSPVALWESAGGGRLLYGVLHDELQKLLKERVNRAKLQKWRPSRWLQALQNKRSSQCSTSDLWLVANILQG